MGHEAETPGKLRNFEQFQTICLRYHTAGKLAVGKRLLDVGCGAGLGLDYLTKRAKLVVGGDFDPENITIAKKHCGNRANLLVMDAHKLPFKKNSFDIVIAMEVIYYLYDVSGFLSECHRVLKRKGILLISLPNKDLPGFKKSKLSRQYYSSSELNRLLKNCRFVADFFGAFPQKSGKASAWQRVTSFLFRGVGKILAVIPKQKRVKEIFYKQVLDMEPLKEKIEEEDMGVLANVQLEKISKVRRDYKHKILYAIAKRR